MNLPPPEGWSSWEGLNERYRQHIRAETEWLRRMNEQRQAWEDGTMAMRALLQPYWDSLPTSG